MFIVSDEMNITSSRLKRALWTSLGTFFLCLGVVGIVIPILPTTPFLLLAAFCYFRGSERMYKWLLSNKWFGEYIKNYREGKGVPLKVKVLAISFLWAAIGFSAFFVVDNIWIRLILLIIAIGVSIHIITLRTLRK